MLKSSPNLPERRRSNDWQRGELVVEYPDLNADLECKMKLTTFDTLEDGSVPVALRQTCGCHTRSSQEAPLYDPQHDSKTWSPIGFRWKEMYWTPPEALERNYDGMWAIGRQSSLQHEKWSGGPKTTASGA